MRSYKPPQFFQLILFLESQSENIYYIIIYYICKTVDLIPWICPELSEVHVKGKIHEFLWEVSDGENVKSDSNSDWGTAIVRSDSSVVANLEGVEDGRDVKRAGGRDVQEWGEGEREEDGEAGHGSDVAATTDLCQLRLAALTLRITKV